MDELIQDFLKLELEGGRMKSTVAQYGYTLNDFVMYLKKDIENLKVIDIEEYKGYLHSQGLKVKTINYKVIIINKFIAYLNLHKGFSIDSKGKVEKIQAQDTLEFMLEKRDLDKILNRAIREEKEKLALLIKVLRGTGSRISEALSITVNELEENSYKYIQVRGKGGKFRYAYITDELAQDIREYITRRGTDDIYLFENSIGGHISRQYAYYMFNDLGRRCKVNKKKLKLHNIRHMFCIKLIEEGFTIDEVADMAGHADINTTRIYTRKTREELRNKLNNVKF